MTTPRSNSNRRIPQLIPHRLLRDSQIRHAAVLEDAKSAAAAGVVVLGAVTVAFLPADQPARHEVTSSPTVTVAAPPPIAQTTTPAEAAQKPPARRRSLLAVPPNAKHKATPDQKYLALFTQESGLIVIDPAPLIALGHQQCDYLSRPWATINDAAAVLRAQYLLPGQSQLPQEILHSALTRQQAHGIVDAATKAYCPQYAGKTP